MPKNEVKSGTALALPAESDVDAVFDAAAAAIKKKTAKAADRGRDWYGTVTVAVAEQKRPYIVKVFADGLVLYTATNIRERQVTVRTGKTKAL